MKTAIIAALIGAVAIGGALGAFAATRTVETTANVEVRVWQRISDGALFLSTRPPEGQWTTSAPLNMGELSQTGSFRQSSIITVAVPVSVEVEVPDAVETGPTRTPPPARPLDSETPVAGPCCEIAGMGGNTAVREAVQKTMQEVIDFALEEYGLAHTGTITINIAYSASGLLNRYEDAFGEELEELPDKCSFQEGEHIFLTPACREDRTAIASEWLTRALGTGDTTPEWIGHGVFDYVLTHFLSGDPPTITEDRFRRAVFYERARDVRRDQASDDMKTLAMMYAITDYGEFEDWRRFYGGVYSGLEAGTAFENVFKATLTEFFGDFEEWADHQKIILISTAFPSCLEASRHITREPGSVGIGFGYPDYRVPLEIDDDDDGVVCEGFIDPLSTTPTQTQ